MGKVLASIESSKNTTVKNFEFEAENINSIVKIFIEVQNNVKEKYPDGYITKFLCIFEGKLFYFDYQETEIVADLELKYSDIKYFKDNCFLQETTRTYAELLKGFKKRR